MRTGARRRRARASADAHVTDWSDDAPGISNSTPPGLLNTKDEAASCCAAAEHLRPPRTTFLIACGGSLAACTFTKPSANIFAGSDWTMPMRRVGSHPRSAQSGSCPLGSARSDPFGSPVIIAPDVLFTNEVTVDAGARLQAVFPR